MGSGIKQETGDDMKHKHTIELAANHPGGEAFIDLLRHIGHDEYTGKPQATFVDGVNPFYSVDALRVLNLLDVGYRHWQTVCSENDRGVAHKVFGLTLEEWDNG